MTNEQLAEIQARLKASTPEAWDVMRCRVDIAALLAEVRRLQAENERHVIDIRHNAEDWADDDTRIREACKRVFPVSKVEGDSYFVPPMAELCEMVVSKCEALQATCERLKSIRNGQAVEQPQLSATGHVIPSLQHGNEDDDIWVEWMAANKSFSFGIWIGEGLRQSDWWCVEHKPDGLLDQGRLPPELIAFIKSQAAN